MSRSRSPLSQFQRLAPARRSAWTEAWSSLPPCRRARGCIARPDRRERARLRKAERRMARARKGSPEQQAERTRIARLRAREADRRKDWCEKVSTGLARRFDVICFEDLRIKNMVRSAKGAAGNPGRNVRAKSGLNRAILAQGWGLLVRRTQDKAPGRVEKVRATYTSLRCSACG